MNLTSKRMLQFLSLCAGAFALTATAQTVFVADNFEAEGVGYTNAAINDAAGMYKANVWGTQSQYTNLVWEAGAGDASTIQAFDGTYAAGRPITNDNAKAQALKLETEGQTLTRYVAFTEDGGSGSDGIPLTTPDYIDVTSALPVYVDTLMKFTPSEDDPEVTDTNIKLALFVNVNSNLVLRHKYYVGGSGYLTTNSVFADLGVIDPEKWYRLTIKMQYNEDYADAMQCWLWLDGVSLTHQNGEVSEEVQNGGPIFYTLKETDMTLSQVSFQGTGYVDDLVVARDITPFGGQAGLTLTLAFDDDVLDVLVDGQPVQPSAVVESGSTLAITAVDWYQINSVTGDGITYTGTTGELEGESTGTITADGPDKTATINASQYTGSIPTGFPQGHPYETLPANKLAAWAVASGLSEQAVASNAADYLDNYLLNIDESIDAQLEITSIVYDPVLEIATITVGATDPAVDFRELNGTLVVQTTDDLATGFGATTEYDITLTAAGEVTIEVEAIAGNFIRAYVQ